MTKPTAGPPDRPKAQREAKREENLARALRDNLRRRKAQAQARAGEPAPVSASPHPGDKKGGA